MKSKRFHVWMCLTVIALSFAITTGITQAQSDDGVVAVGGVTILTIRIPAAGMTVKQRADAVTARLRQILADPMLKASDIVVAPSGKNATIMVKDRLLVTVEVETAQLSSTTPMKLANLWAKHLRDVLPKLNVKPNPNDNKTTGK